ncbi:MAG TPA: hypothetical protein ENN55_01065 [Firmicutes bacterium]|nr:hypothetical protein [Bacillota bacterium]
MGENEMQIASHLLAVLGGIFFWAAFFVFGLIARRYSVVFNKSTYHTLLMLAPSGILVYSILLIMKTSVLVTEPAVGAALQLAAYIFLLVSGIICLAGMLKFNRLLNELIKYEG